MTSHQSPVTHSDRRRIRALLAGWYLSDDLAATRLELASMGVHPTHVRRLHLGAGPAYGTITVHPVDPSEEPPHA